MRSRSRACRCAHHRPLALRRLQQQALRLQLHGRARPEFGLGVRVAAEAAVSAGQQRHQPRRLHGSPQPLHLGHRLLRQPPAEPRPLRLRPSPRHRLDDSGPGEAERGRRRWDRLEEEVCCGHGEDGSDRRADGKRWRDT